MSEQTIDRPPAGETENRARVASRRLSICIPTYNFGKYIGETLASIVPQLTDGVDIVVLDGGSTDNTPEVVNGFRERCSSIAYHRQDMRGGIDRDMARVMELASGQYCWLFSADDLMKSNAISTVLRWIGSAQDVYVCRHTVCTQDMKYLGEHPILNTASAVEVDLGNVEQRRRYFALAQTTEAFFSFMSGVVVKRSVWASIPLDERFIGSCWAHVARLFALMSNGLSVSCRPDVLVDRRGDNDSFADQGAVNRLRIAVEGYNAIADTFVGQKSECAYHIRRTLRNEYPFGHLMNAAILCRVHPKQEDAQLLRVLIRKLFVDVPLRSWLVRTAIAAIPGAGYVVLRDLYHRLKQNPRRV